VHQVNNASKISRAWKAVLHGTGIVFKWMAKMLGRVLSMLLCIALSVYLAHTLVPDLVREILGFNRAQEISDTIIREELNAISELATYEFTYVNHVDCVDQPQLLGHNVALSDHWFAFDYHGVIKAGFDLEKIDLLWIDSVERMVGIYLPDVVVLSNEIFVDMATYEDRNNLCNPLEPREVLEYLYSRKEPELEKALELGLLEMAKENAMRLIITFVKAQGYTAVFID